MKNYRMNQNGKKIAGLALMLMLALALAGLLLPGTAAAADPDVAQLIHSDGSAGNRYTTVQAAVDAAGTDDTVRLIANEKVGSYSSLTINNNISITLDLNGYTLDRGIGSASPSGYVIYIESGSTLTLVDSSSGKKGTVTGGKGELNGGGVRVAGTLNMYGGTITGNTANNGGGV